VLQVFVGIQIRSSGSWRFNSVAATGGISSSGTNYPAGVTILTNNSDDDVMPSHILSIVPTDPTLNAITVTVNYVNVAAFFPAVSGIGFIS